MSTPTLNILKGFNIWLVMINQFVRIVGLNCLLYTSDAADEEESIDHGGRRNIKKKTTNKQNNKTQTHNTIKQ